jgi:squalene-associated FAD-dependent desaturase
LRAIVIGGGIAGISCAMEFAKKNCEVILLESRNSLGGRFYSFQDKETGEEIDNGQHVLVGAYRNLLKVFKELDTDKYLSYQKALKVLFLDKDGKKSILDTSRFPGKLGLIYGFIRLSGFSLLSKISIINFLNRIKSDRISAVNQTVIELLTENKQQEKVIKRFWEPLVFATMNATLQNASAELFIAVIKGLLLNDIRDSSIIIPTVPFSKLINPFIEWLEKNGGKCQLIHSVKEIIIQNNKAIGVRLNSEEEIFADAIISAVPHESLNNILNFEIIGSHFQEIMNYSYSPIISIYLWFDKEIMVEDFVALLGTHIHWVFNRRRLVKSESQINETYHGHIALTISAAIELINLSDSELIEICLSELRQVLPKARTANLKHHRIIKYKKATVLPTPEFTHNRPKSKTSIDNLYIAGDWTDTGLPATLEGAAVSGVMAAREVIQW